VHFLINQLLKTGLRTFGGHQIGIDDFVRQLAAQHATGSADLFDR